MSTAGTIRNRAKLLWISILCGANVATILLLWGICLSTFFEPSIHPRLAQVGLLFPVLAGLDLAFVILWLITSWKWIALPLVGLLACWGYLRDYCPINFPKEAPGSALKILSYNVGELNKNEEQAYDGMWSVKYISESQADIICLQECPSGGEYGHALQSRMDSLHYEMRQKGSIVTFSRLHFTGDSAIAAFTTGGNGFAAYRIIQGHDSLIIINMHLESNRISAEEKDDYAEAIEETDGHMLENSGRMMLSRLTGSASRREEQTDSLCRFLDEHKGDKIILCGDMNETPISYNYQKIARHLDNTFRQSGNGIGISFNQKGFPVRIDHIFVSSGMQSHLTHIDNSIHSSDHYPILTYVRSVSK